MVTKSPRSHRTASRGRPVPAFNLKRFHNELGAALGKSIDQPGLPQSSSPVSEDGPREFAITYLLGELLSKFDDGSKVGLKAKEHNAMQKFFLAEQACFETNQRLKSLRVFNDSVTQVILLAQRLASKIAGEFDWDQASMYFGWGPGSSTRLPKRQSDAAFKFSGIPETTYGNAALADAAICSIPSWKQELSSFGDQDHGFCKHAEGNSIWIVPKNFKTGRTIAIEPCMNMYIQKGIGGLLRKRLKLFGCNLNDQSRNQRLARIGSLSGLLATIDLSMASDTVARRLVELFIRPDWLKALEMCRSQKGVLPSGDLLFYQKFSSMGNGFTFELESLIFYSLALAVTLITCPGEVHRVSVYGDDIIVPSISYGLLCDVLIGLGFTPNPEKSFAEGPFRESCGKHYFNGLDVTPFYIRRGVVDFPELILLINNLTRWLWQVRIVLGEETTKRVRKLILDLRALLPASERRPTLPDGYGDGALIPFWDECICLHPPRDEEGFNGWEAFEVLVYASPGKERLDVDVHGLLLKSLSRLEKLHRESKVGLSFVKLPTAVSVYPVRGTTARKIKIPIPLSALSYGSALPNFGLEDTP